MSNVNGRPLPLRLTSRLARLSNTVKLLLAKLVMLPPPVALASVLILLVLVTLLAGCATPSQPDAWPKNPPAPQLSEPIPSESYLSKAQAFIESLLNRATGM